MPIAAAAGRCSRARRDACTGEVVARSDCIAHLRLIARGVAPSSRMRNEVTRSPASVLWQRAYRVNVASVHGTVEARGQLQVARTRERTRQTVRR